jgi:glutathione synthase/RimK-type ligase-like ATP-grasp enzyme
MPLPWLSGPELRFCRAQARVAVGGVLANLPARWVSHPSALADAGYKPWQLSRLRRAGLTTPPTLITNKAAAVRDFAARYGDLVVKATDRTRRLGRWR